MLEFLIPLLAFIVILSLLVFVHELGHFVVAKMSGITVEEFAIGFPPRMVKLWQDEGQIVLDGQSFVIGRDISVPRTIQPGATVYAETAVDDQNRAIITKLELIDEEPETDEDKSTQLIDNIEARLLPKGVPAEGRPTITVDRIVRPTEYAINWVPLGGYVRMVGEEDPTDPNSFASKSKRIRFAVLVAGSAMNLVTAVVFFALTALSGVPEPNMGINLVGEEAPIATTVIEEVVEGTPADQAGLAIGDILSGADDVSFNHVGDLVSYVGERKGSEITLQVERDQETLAVPVMLRLNPPEGQGSLGIRLSYDVDSELVYHDPLTAIGIGFQNTAEYVGLTLYMPYAIISNLVPAEAARPTGPVGIYQQTGSAVDAAISLNWWFPVLWLTAILSTALAVTNLLPLPALDGGRIFFIVIEALRGRRVSPEKEGAIHLIGLAMLLTLMIVISYYDVSNPLPSVDWNSLLN